MNKLSPEVGRRNRAVRRAAAVYFVLVSVGMIWPVYPFFSRIDPVILGIPFALFYQVLLLLLSFLVLLGLFLYEDRQGGDGR